MATVEDFILKINVQGQGNIKAISADVGNLKKDIEGLSQAGGPLGNTINGIVGKLGPLGVALSLAATAFAAFGGKALQIAGELSDISGATGIATGQIQNFRTSLIEAGGKAEDASLILSKLNQSVQEAAGGNEKLQQAFKDLGVFVTDANGKIRPTGDILQDITEKAQRGEITQKAYAAAVDILGKNINKLELGKLSALRDPVADADIKRLDAYNEAIDRVRDKLSKGIITFFGSVAEQAEKAFAAIDKYEKKVSDREAELNQKGLTARAATGPGQQPMSGAITGANLPDWMQRQMTAEEKAFLEQRKRYAEQERLMAAYKSRAGAEGARDGAGGGFGEMPEATKKAIEESNKRIAQSKIESDKLIALKGANDIMALEINAKAETEKAKSEIFSKERLSDAQKAQEFAAKTAEIEGKLAIDTAKLKSQLNARIYTELETQRQKSADELAAEETRINAIVESTRRLVTLQQSLVKQTQEVNQFNRDTALLSDKERANRKAIFDLEQDRKKLIVDIQNTKDLPYAEQLAKIQEINVEFEERKRLTNEQQADDRALSENFQAGFEKAYANYVESSRNAFEQAATYFNTFTKGFEDAWVKMIETGKFAWKDLVGSMIQELARAQIRQTMANIIGGFSKSPQSGGNGIFGGSIIPGFLARGGTAGANRPYIVGEQGPELFVPRTGGTVIPNGSFGGGGGSSSMVTYNINAVDAPSFKAMIARDPSFIHAVAMQGSMTIPGRR